MDWQEIENRMVERRRRRKDAIDESVKDAGDIGFLDIAVESADFADLALAMDDGAVRSFAEYVGRFTRDCPADRELMKQNLANVVAAL